MGSLSAALGAANRSLQSFSSALQVVQNNIANATTPGFARQRVSLAPVTLPEQSAQAGLGVEITGIQALRSRVLDLQVLRTRQAKTGVEKEAAVFESVETAFPLEGGIAAGLDEFFGSISALAVNPGDFDLRAQVLSSARGLAGSFRTAFNDLSGQQRNLESEARSKVSRINTLLGDIAELAKNPTRPEDRFPNFASDTRLDQLLNELSEEIGFDLLRQSDGTVSLITENGRPLVVGSRDFPISVSVDNQGIRVFDAQGEEITAGIQEAGGELGAILKARNQTLPGLLNEVNRLAKAVATRVNEQQARGVDVTGQPGDPIFASETSFFAGSGRTPGTAGAATPSPPVSVTVDFSGGVTGSITAELDSFFVASAPPSAPAAGDTVSVTFTSEDGGIERTITTAPLLGGETADEIAVRLNDQIALDPELAGLVTFSEAGGALKAVLSGEAGQGFSFTSTTSDPAFTTGLETGGELGGHSAAEIAAALNAEAAADPALTSAGVRFSAVGGEVRLDAGVEFDFTITDNDPAGTGFASGLAGSGTAGGALVAPTIDVSAIGPAGIAAGAPEFPAGNGNLLALEQLSSLETLDGVNFHEFYTTLVREAGDSSAAAQAQVETQEQLLLAAEGMRDRLSGVDVNEEALQLVQFEQAFQATLRVIQVVNGLADDLLGLVR